MNDRASRLMGAQGRRVHRRHGRDASLRWTIPTYLAHENGSRGFTVERSEVYAEAFKVNAAWLLTGHGPPSGMTMMVPVAGYVGTGGTVSMADALAGTGPPEQLEFPPGSFNADAVFKVRGDGAYPVRSAISIPPS